MLPSVSELLPQHRNSLSGTTQLMPLSYAPFSPTRASTDASESELPAVSSFEPHVPPVLSPPPRPSGRWMDKERALDSESHLVPNPTLRELRGAGGGAPTTINELLESLGLPPQEPLYAKVPVWQWDTRALFNGGMPHDPAAAEALLQRAAEERGTALEAEAEAAAGEELPSSSTTVPGSQLDRAAAERDQALALQKTGRTAQAHALILKAVDREEYTEEGLRAKARRHKALALECGRAGDVDGARVALDVALRLEAEADVCRLDADELLRRSKAAQLRAVELKRGGDISGALSALRVAKKLAAFARRGEDPVEIARRAALVRLEEGDMEGAAESLAEWRKLLPAGSTATLSGSGGASASGSASASASGEGETEGEGEGSGETEGDGEGEGEAEAEGEGEGEAEGEGEGEAAEPPKAAEPAEPAEQQERAELQREQDKQDRELALAEAEVVQMTTEADVRQAKRAALAKRRDGDMEGARAALARARELETDLAIAGHKRRALERKHAGDVAGAARALAQARELEKERADGLKRAALAAREAGDLDGARAALAKLHDIESHGASAQKIQAAKRQARASRKVGDLKSAVTAMRAARHLERAAAEASARAARTRVEHLKRSALESRAAGDLAGAAHALKLARDLERRAAERTAQRLAEEAHDMQHEPVAPPALPENPAQRIADLKRQAVLRKRRGDAKGAVQLMQEAMALQQLLATTSAAHARVDELKRHALALKKEGRRDSALQVLRQARELEATLPVGSSGGSSSAGGGSSSGGSSGGGGVAAAADALRRGA